MISIRLFQSRTSASMKVLSRGNLAGEKMIKEIEQINKKKTESREKNGIRMNNNNELNVIIIKKTI